MKKISTENKLLVSNVERLLRARIQFAEERLTLINGMILDQKDMKVKGVSPEKIKLAKAEFKTKRESLVITIADKYNKNPNLNKIVSAHSKKGLVAIREGGYNV